MCASDNVVKSTRQSTLSRGWPTVSRFEMSTGSHPPCIAAVEAGGTKFRSAVFAPRADGALDLVDETRIPTTTPAHTLAAVGDFLEPLGVTALGIASFGPLIVDRSSRDYGVLAATPKPGWSGARVLPQLRDRLGVPADIVTDVEAGAIAEQFFGAGTGRDSVAYVTVGTGIGVGVAVGGEPLRGRDHIELGHMPVRRDPNDAFGGSCPFHQDCLEGLASGPAIALRAGRPAHELAADHPVWDRVADELGQLACVITWAFSPDRILFSGGVGSVAHLEPRIKAATARHLAGYSVSHATDDDLVATAGLGNDAGLVGAALLGASLIAN